MLSGSGETSTASMSTTSSPSLSDDIFYLKSVKNRSKPSKCQNLRNLFSFDFSMHQSVVCYCSVFLNSEMRKNEKILRRKYLMLFRYFFKKFKNDFSQKRTSIKTFFKLVFFTKILSFCFFISDFILEL